MDEESVWRFRITCYGGAESEELHKVRYKVHSRHQPDGHHWAKPPTALQIDSSVLVSGIAHGLL